MLLIDSADEYQHTHEYTTIKNGAVWPRSQGLTHYSLTGSICQIWSAYSLIVRSEEK